LIPPLLLHVVMVDCYNHNGQTAIPNCFHVFLDDVWEWRLHALAER